MEYFPLRVGIGTVSAPTAERALEIVRAAGYRPTGEPPELRRYILANMDHWSVQVTDPLAPGEVLDPRR